MSCGRQMPNEFVASLRQATDPSSRALYQCQLAEPGASSSWALVVQLSDLSAWMIL